MLPYGQCMERDPPRHSDSKGNSSVPGRQIQRGFPREGVAEACSRKRHIRCWMSPVFMTLYHWPMCPMMHKGGMCFAFSPTFLPIFYAFRFSKARILSHFPLPRGSAAGDPAALRLPTAYLRYALPRAPLAEAVAGRPPARPHRPARPKVGRAHLVGGPCSVDAQQKCEKKRKDPTSRETQKYIVYWKQP